MNWRVKLGAAIAAIAYRDAFFVFFFFGKDNVASRFLDCYRRNRGVAGAALKLNLSDRCFQHLARKVRRRDCGDSVSRRFFLRFFFENDIVASRFFDCYRRNRSVADATLALNYFDCCF